MINIETARADVVGSLLRPDYLLDAKIRIRKGEIGVGELKAIEDRAVLEAIELQESAGLQVITDGEFRRNSWVAIIPVRDDPIYEPPVSGFKFFDIDALWWSLWKDPSGNPVKTEDIKDELGLYSHPFICSKLNLNRDIVRDEYGFLKDNANVRTKFNIPSPSWHRIYWHKDYSSNAYPTSDEFIKAIAEFLRDHVVEPLLSMDCDYIQLDAPNYSQWHIDPRNREAFEENGHDMAHELIADAEFDNMVFEGVNNITTAMHLCRGNARGGKYFASGGYDVISKKLFPRLPNINTFLLEYDTDRAGGFEPLADTLEHQNIVLGLVTTKDEKLEDKNALVARVQEASKYIPLERLAISTQCGFASGELARTISTSIQNDKLRLVCEVAGQIWN